MPIPPATRVTAADVPAYAIRAVRHDMRPVWWRTMTLAVGVAAIVLAMQPLDGMVEGFSLPETRPEVAAASAAAGL